MLRCMTRTLTVGNSQSILLPSTTGAPEGCGMSVVAMACITYWCGRFILERVPPARPICYADNWNVLSNTPKFLLDAIKCIEFFVQKLRLTINPKKSWLWSTRPSHRKNLRGTKIGSDVLPVVCNTSDLGCDLHYSRKVCKPTGKKRWSKAHRVCKKIAISKAPKVFDEDLQKGQEFLHLIWVESASCPKNTMENPSYGNFTSLGLLWGWRIAVVSSGNLLFGSTVGKPHYSVSFLA